ncbi:hypothetical protein OESDEN_11795 [Oesophagostomum dentatum]|uniref:Uncharacterized protein n=1 Tax=Oesophagostomum dentatum TaxID=61180 RepID=A0A0B1SSX3_OESDE|nr:hypothetical protein OESDEN_11795 [Oesophagostomum dentatum]
MVLRSYYIQKLLHLVGFNVGFYPANAKVLERKNEDRKLASTGTTLPSAYEMVKFLKGWSCNDTLLEFCMVLIIIDNHQRKSGFGLLQRLYQPYFGLTIFCGTWKPDEYKDDGHYPEMLHPFNYIHVSAAELVKGVFMYFCLAKVRELKLRNVKGYFMSGDDVLFQFWHELSLEEILYPTWVIEQRCPSSWWPTRYGRTAAKRASKLLTEKYRNNGKVKQLLECYVEGLSAQGHPKDAAMHIADDNGSTLSDFYYVPQKRLNYLADALEIFFEAELFVEIAMNKLLQTVPYNKISPENFTYVPNGRRDYWKEYYLSELIMMHPVKISYFENLENRLG